MNKIEIKTKTETKEGEIQPAFNESIKKAKWEEQRQLVLKADENGYKFLAQHMNRIYHEKVCGGCLGTMRIVEGEFDNQTEKPCTLCQV